MTLKLKIKYMTLFLRANRRENGHMMHLINEECLQYGYTKFNDMI